jgi:hypothetical protein
MRDAYKKKPGIIQSYIRNRWMVSTIYRSSSAALAPDTWYYETIVWEWDIGTRERGKQLSCEEGGVEYHFAKCLELLEKDRAEDKS